MAHQKKSLANHRSNRVKHVIEIHWRMKSMFSSFVVAPRHCHLRPSIWAALHASL